MIRRTRCLNLFFFIGLLLTAGAGVDRLPDQLSDQEFWRIVEEFSEPNGYFRSDNLVSNESAFQRVIPDLLSRASPGAVYMGVGPEQNFTYIASLRPPLAFIVDIRRGNLHTQLMYKALFELSQDRADFVSLLFSRKRPEGLSAASTAKEIFDAFGKLKTSGEDVFKDNLARITDLLTREHSFPLPESDLAGIKYIYQNFYEFGPGINYGSSLSKLTPLRGQNPMYADLMTKTDQNGVSRSFLSSEQDFRMVKEMQHSNLIIPLVGDFAGPKAIRKIGAYLQESGATVGVFYVSNVEYYLDTLRGKFCSNVASLPLHEQSVFIRSFGSGDNPSVLVGMLDEASCPVEPH